MIENSLSKLGFSPSEIKVYLLLVEKGPSYANKISSETKINRTNVYEALDRLLAKGVISFITKNKMKWFEATNIKSISSLINSKKENLIQIEKQIIQDVKKLKKNSIPKSLEANIFTGKKGLRIIFEEILDCGKPISLIASELQFKEIFGHYFELWHKKRTNKKISQRSIFSKMFKNKVEKIPFLKYKFVENKFINPTTTIIYGDNCVFINWDKEPIAIKIQNKKIMESHLNYFNLIWNS